MGDALAVALLDSRGFQAEDFIRSHPGGRLGRKQLMHVSEVMRSFDDTPKISIDASLQDALLEMTSKRMGMVVIQDAKQKVFGILTDGDLRRLLEKTTNLDGIKLASATKADPRTIPPELIAEEAIEMMEKHRINHLVVTDRDGHLLGALNLHDLFAAKVI
jgi:arabinose-5-phosphate isomerase